MTQRRKLLADSCLLPLREGALAVSRSHAVFCPLDAGQVDPFCEALSNTALVERLDGVLAESLEQYGFFSSPRPRAATRPIV